MNLESDVKHNLLLPFGTFFINSTALTCFRRKPLCLVNREEELRILVRLKTC